MPVIVADNASGDDTLDRVRGYADVRLIANQENIGFAAAVNQAVAAAGSPFLLLLNPDVELDAGGLSDRGVSRPGMGLRPVFFAMLRARFGPDSRHGVFQLLPCSRPRFWG